MSLNLLKRGIKEFSTFYASDWITRDTTAQLWESVVYAPNQDLYVAVSSNGTNKAFTSPNGLTWTLRSTTANNRPLNSVAYSQTLGLFVAVSISASTTSVIRSSNGISWSDSTTPTSISFRKVIWSSERSLFVAVGDGGANRVMTSPDGITWTGRSVSLLGWVDLCWSPELQLFVAINTSSSAIKVMTSSDAVNWSDISVSGGDSFRCICWSPEFKKFFILGALGVHSSVDGSNWIQESTISLTNPTSIVWSKELGIFVATLTANNFVLVSQDGVYWDRLSIPTSLSWSQVIWNEIRGIFVAVGNNRIITTKELGIGWGK